MTRRHYTRFICVEPDCTCTYPVGHWWRPGTVHPKCGKCGAELARMSAA